MIYEKTDYIQEQYDEDVGDTVALHIEKLTDIETGEVKFRGQVGLMFEMGGMRGNRTVAFEIPATDIHDAFSQFKEVSAHKVEEAKQQIEEQLREMQRQQNQRIITPTPDPNAVIETMKGKSNRR